LCCEKENGDGLKNEQKYVGFNPSFVQFSIIHFEKNYSLRIN